MADITAEQVARAIKCVEHATGEPELVAALTRWRDELVAAERPDDDVRARYAAALIAALPFLAGCVPAVIATGATVGVMSAQDRRSTGVQADDEGFEWKAAQSVPESYTAASHLNFTSFNQRLLITGEVPSEEAKTAIREQAARIVGVKEVINDAVVGPASSLSVRSNDSYITSKVKDRLVDEKSLSATQDKAATESGVT